MQYTRTLILGQRNAAARTVEATLSSETPYFREGFGNEILMHSPECVDLARAPLPLLISHNHEALPVGVVENLRLAGRKLRGTLRFSTSARASEIWEDVKSGVARNISIGYNINDYILEPEGDIVRVTSWTPHEASVVSVPADFTVGIGRFFQRTSNFNFPEDHLMNEDAQVAERDTTMSRSQRRAEARQESGRLQEVTDLLAMGEGYKQEKLAAQFIRDGKTPEQFRLALLDRLSTPPMRTDGVWQDMSHREQRQFSITKAILAQTDPAWGMKNATLEREVSETIAQQRGKPARGFLVPPEAFKMKRDLTVGTTTAGGHLVQTDVMGDQFIDLLRARSAVMGLGARVIAGLIGSVAIPRKTAGATGQWVAEGNSATETTPGFDQVTLAPKSVSGFMDITRKLLLQASLDVERLVKNDLAEALATAIDVAAINGSGTPPIPRGILQTTGIGDVAGGTNGLAPTWTHMVALESALANANADRGSLGYLTNSKVRGKLKTVEKVATTGAFVWGDSAASPLNGYRADVSNNVPSNLTKGTSSGVCSAIIFGNWDDLLIGLWSGVDLLVDQFTLGTSGGVRVVAFQDCDIAIRHPESFAAMLDALT